MHEIETSTPLPMTDDPLGSLRVLHLVSVGGAGPDIEGRVSAMRDALEARGHDVRVIAFDAAGGGRHPLGDLTVPPIAGRRPARAARQAWHHQAFMDVGGLRRTFRPEVVHLHTLEGLGLAAITAVRGLPTVLSVHDEEHLRALRSPVMRRMLRPGRVLAPSRFLAEQAARAFPADAVHVLEPGIDMPHPVAPPAGRTILFAGELGEGSGAELLMHAALPLLHNGRAENLIVVGDGPERGRLERMAAISGQTARITMLGRRSRTETLRELERAAVLVVPSERPGPVPPVALDALGVGRPVVATRTGALPEIVEDRRTGRLVEPGDGAGLAEALAWVLEDGPRHEALSRASGAAAARFTTRRFTAELDRHHREAAAT